MLLFAIRHSKRRFRREVVAHTPGRLHHKLCSLTDLVGRRPHADHLDGRLAVGPVTAAAQSFAVNGDDLSTAYLLQRRDPTQQTLFKLRRFERRQDRIEAVVRRHAVFQVKKPRQPTPFLLAEFGNRHEIVGPANNRTYGDDHNIHQWICYFAAARVGKFGKVVL